MLPTRELIDDIISTILEILPGIKIVFKIIWTPILVSHLDFLRTTLEHCSHIKRFVFSSTLYTCDGFINTILEILSKINITFRILSILILVLQSKHLKFNIPLMDNSLYYIYRYNIIIHYSMF